MTESGKYAYQEHAPRPGLEWKLGNVDNQRLDMPHTECGQNRPGCSADNGKKNS